MKTRAEIDAIVAEHQFGIGQQPEDSAEFVEILQEHGVKTMLQIGVAHGSDAVIFLRCLPEMRWLGIDIDKGSGVGVAKWLDENPADRNRTALIFDGSQKAPTLGAAVACFEGKPIDCLFIDGDHKFDGVVSDYAFYSPLVKSGGLIAFHDINIFVGGGWKGDNPPDPSCHVPAFWDAIRRSSGKSIEIGRAPDGRALVSRTGRRREGFGVVVKP